MNNINVKYELGSWLFPEYDSIHAINDVSLDLYSNHITSIIGESGSGKSTIAKAILGLEKIDSGEIRSYMDNHKDIVW